ncbi:unnamed protein product [Adineta steineri]|uniref:Zinc finger protein 830 n=1 Tax=Adineta steineri TaxID=433720 RepID=A0A813XR69_9BILA|nr:unnamed protein product [Adineta steineri]
MASKSVDKTTLRQLMKQEKQKRIDSPLAKYTNTGQLCCALCNQQLTSETFWKAHINGREHKQKLLELKSNIKQTNSDSVFTKPFPPPPLSNQQQQQRGIKRPHEVDSNDHVIVGKPSATVPTISNSALPADFFDSESSKPQIETNKPVIITSQPTTNIVTASTEKSSAIPEGFFDNPELDARMRKVEYVDKMEIEWDTFTREMKQETNISDKLEANDDIDRDVEREIVETDELITRWQKIEEMHDVKDNRFKVVKKSQKQIKKEMEDDDDNEEDLEQELQNMYNWRQKRS